MKLNLPASVSSLQDLRGLTMEVRNYAKAYSHAAIKQKLNVQDSANTHITVSPACSELLNAWAGKQGLDPAKLDELISSLAALQSSAPVLTITLAAPAAASLKQALVAWCRDNIEANILVNFQFNSTILGGMVVRYGSRVFDWSFRRRILAGRNSFPEHLRQAGVAHNV